MSKWLMVLVAGLLLQACGVAPEATEVERGELHAGPGAPGALVCCGERFHEGARRGLCIAEAARGEGPCASSHHPGGGGGRGCQDAGAEKDAAEDAGNHCPSVVSISVSPETTLAAKFGLSAAIDGNGAPAAITFDWHLVGASVGKLEIDPATQEATFVCTSLGTETVELTITGGDPAATCASSGSVTVACTSLCGNATVDPGEACDPPDGATCDSTCNLLNHCPTIASVIAVTTNVNNKNYTPVTAIASDSDPGDTLTYAWSVTSGYVFQDITTATVSYMCTEVGVHTVTVTVSDGKCSATGSVDINCYAWCGDSVVSPGEQCDPPQSGVCSTTCQTVLCGNGVLDPGEQCDPPQSGLCSSTCQTQPVVCGDGVIGPGETCNPPRGPSPTNGLLCDSTCHIPTCGNGVLDPGEACDPPNDATCDRTCQPIPVVCGNGIQQMNETCDLGPTTPTMCRNCQLTNCGGCFVAVGGGNGVCSGLDVEDTQACSALVTCAANNMAFCADFNLAGCYCAGAPASNCSAGGDGPCVAQFQALAHSDAPAVVMAQIGNPLTPVGKVAAAMFTFAHSSCGSPCFVFNN